MDISQHWARITTKSVCKYSVSVHRIQNTLFHLQIPTRQQLCSIVVSNINQNLRNCNRGQHFENIKPNIHPISSRLDYHIKVKSTTAASTYVYLVNIAHPSSNIFKRLFICNIVHKHDALQTSNTQYWYTRYTDVTYFYHIYGDGQTCSTACPVRHVL